MNDKKNNLELNGINTQILNTAFESMRNFPERAKVTFSAKSHKSEINTVKLVKIG